MHLEIILRWFDGLHAGEAVLCRLVQLALKRLEFAAEPAPLDSAFPRLLTYSVPTNKLVSDAYRAAFAIAGTLRLATLDSGFEQFRGLDLELLST